jgi:hypothetical protein
MLREVTFDSIEQDEELEREIRALYFFFYDVLMRGPNFERSIEGCSFSQRGLNTLMVLKGTCEGIPQVAYVTEKFPIGCVVTAGRLLLDGRMKWHLDKFRST